jgi:hypothetical protein
MVLPRPCAGCGKVVRASRCLECQRVKDRARPTRTQRGYDYSWKKLSKQLREQQPYCSIPGCTNKDLTVDQFALQREDGEAKAKTQAEKSALHLVADSAYKSFADRYNDAKDGIEDGTITTGDQVTAKIGGA